MQTGKYKCSYCDKEWESPINRANCEIACYKKNFYNEEVEKRNKLKSERIIRLQEIRKAQKDLDKFQKDLDELKRKYYDDYNLILLENDSYSLPSILNYFLNG